MNSTWPSHRRSPARSRAACTARRALSTLPLTLVAPPTVNHNPTTEPRQGPAQTIVFTFDKPITGATATVTEGTATAGAPTFSGNDVVVALTGVTDRQYVTVSLTNVASADGGTGGVGSARVGFLVGDVNQTRVVSVADLGLVNAQLSQVVDGGELPEGRERERHADAGGQGHHQRQPDQGARGALTTEIPAG